MKRSKKEDRSAALVAGICFAKSQMTKPNTRAEQVERAADRYNRALAWSDSDEEIDVVKQLTMKTLLYDSYPYLRGTNADERVTKGDRLVISVKVIHQPASADTYRDDIVPI